MKQRILDAAVAEIELHGSSFRIDDLAKRLNISKRTLLEDDSLDVVTKLKTYFTVKSDLYAAISGDHYRLMFASVPSLLDQVMRTFERDWDLFGDFLKEQQRLGIIRDLNIDILLLMLKGVVKSVFYDGQRNPQDCIDILTEAMYIILHGILNEETENE